MKDDIKKLTPSTFQYIHQCPCWERKPSPPNDAMLRGTAMDNVLRNYLLHDMKSLDGLSHKLLKRKDYLALEWAGNTIRRVCNGKPVLSKKSDCKLKFEINGVLISGEMDAYSPTAKHIFDLKSGGVRDYEMQMLPYAYYAIHTTNQNDMCTDLVFCDHRLTRSKWFSKSEADERVEAFVNTWLDENKIPLKCNACKFCKFYKEANNTCEHPRA